MNASTSNACCGVRDRHCQTGHAAGEGWTYFGAVSFRLLFATLLLELHLAELHHRGDDVVDVVLLLLGEGKHVEGGLGEVDEAAQRLATRAQRERWCGVCALKHASDH